MTTESRNALIVGASRGLGLGLARVFLDRGWRVTATQRSPSPGLAGLGTSLRVETVDIDDDGSVASLRDRLAGERFGLIFVVAGVAAKGDDKGDDVAHTIPREEAARILLTNAVSPLRFAETFRPSLAEGGTLAFMSSILGSVARNEDGGMEIYRASKAALNTLVRSFAARHPGSSLLLLHPGWVETDMGGEGADIDVATSARGLAEVIEARLGRPGLAYLDYRGETLPW
ncbi:MULTISPECIES: SDR family oxidoreductase [Methylobacterium]|uniref:Short-chain dehydrogenase n=2 Tax=Pseudomonadota TaxID=1224 RepID=A0ABQ4SU44_9HYPH|nr:MULTISPECIES: SDR family oxidoreductase [Methylobacterium]PIU06215.1 MAG: short-chain dehydrogenase [Methylobacterium sp. CG09_land_8_20_14_0_10_71_15]PIU14506.1 MAG: short-chain dehydrogenase [Methylobacterium sp. CG08_land_8_20_14_0_20_71_15]GBU19325.1 short-chain dehydrogenase [Methylobacterium sp.]GJE05196.1 hypothetical protein AOPFMNJM_0493 [Methylobacterium jeotgali]